MFSHSFISRLFLLIWQLESRGCTYLSLRKLPLTMNFYTLMLISAPTAKYLLALPVIWVPVARSLTTFVMNRYSGILAEIYIYMVTKWGICALYSRMLNNRYSVHNFQLTFYLSIEILLYRSLCKVFSNIFMASRNHQFSSRLSSNLFRLFRIISDKRISLFLLYSFKGTRSFSDRETLGSSSSWRQKEHSDLIQWTSNNIPWRRWFV